MKEKGIKRVTEIEEMERSREKAKETEHPGEELREEIEVILND